MKTIKVKPAGNKAFCGEGFYAGRIKYVRLDGVWYSTNNKDWEPECPIRPNIKFEIVT
jgi:hypothetical protein